MEAITFTNPKQHKRRKNSEFLENITADMQTNDTSRLQMRRLSLEQWFLIFCPSRLPKVVFL